MSLFEIKVEIPAAAAEDTETLLLEMGVVGWSLLEDVIVRRAWVVGIFASEGEASAHWTELRPLLPAAPLGKPVIRALEDQDWRESYKVHFKAWKFGPLHWVPLWEKEIYPLPPGDAAIWLDPGMAFGTGNHETTRLCVERLVALAAKTKAAAPAKSTDTRVIDAGCGSGILALSAARLGFSDVVAFDNDPEAIRISRENAALNGLAEKVNFFVGDLLSGLAGRSAGIVLANIQADVLMRFAPELTQAVTPGGALVLSGILASEIDQVTAAFAHVAPAWRRESRTLSEWSDLQLERPNFLEA